MIRMPEEQPIIGRRAGVHAVPHPRRFRAPRQLGTPTWKQPCIGAAARTGATTATVVMRFTARQAP